MLNSFLAHIFDKSGSIYVRFGHDPASHVSASDFSLGATFSKLFGKILAKILGRF